MNLLSTLLSQGRGLRERHPVKGDHGAPAVHQLHELSEYIREELAASAGSDERLRAGPTIPHDLQ